VRLVLAAILASLALATPASAAAPELFVRLQPWDTHEAVSDWIPLASAPALSYVGGYEIGYKLQAPGFQRVALTVTGVPDGVPTQPSNAEPFCVGRNGAAGTIAAAGPELQFEGNGTYTVKVSVGGDDCLTAGESGAGSFSVGAQAAPVLFGTPFSFRATAPPGNPFVGVRAAAPPGGYSDIRCARDATVQADGSVTGANAFPSEGFVHPEVPEFVFPRPGSWSCVARGTADARTDDLDSTFFTTPWSAPITFDVRSDFRRRVGVISRPRSKRPRLTFKAEWPDVAAGGRASVTLFRVAGCKGKAFKLRRAGTFRGRFGAKRMRITVKRPKAVGYYLGRFAFSGTRFLRRSVDPNPLLLLALRDRLEYVPRKDFPGC